MEDENVDDDDVDDDDDVESEEDDDVEEDDVEEEDRSQDRDPHFAGACAVEMHVDISPEPLYTEICKKNVRPRLSPKRRHTHRHFVRACAVETQVKI